MIHVHTFTFNPFQENTFIVYDDTGECMIIDPGCYEAHEERELVDFIEEKQLKPVRLLNTHCHIDHVFGNDFIARTYHLELEIHEKELPILEAVVDYGKLFGLHVMPPPAPGRFLEENESIKFGNMALKTIFVPGHAPGHVAFVCDEEKWVISGDVLFYQSIGRTDLPGGDHATLLNSIRSEMFGLPDDYKVYCGHGPTTTIGYEKKHNPFLT